MNEPRSPPPRRPGAPVRFAETFVASGQFKALFREGMELVEETAAYLDGPGRMASRRLPRTTALAYATQSMRLTTCLMQVASWLLLQRAVGEGEMSRAEAERDKARISLAEGPSALPPGEADGLPDGLMRLVQRSARLNRRVLHLDRLINAGLRDGPAGVTEIGNPVRDQITRLRGLLSG